MISHISHDYFSFQLKNEGYRSYRKRTSVIFILNALAFIFISIRAVSSFQRILLLVMATLLVVYGLYCLVSRSSKKYEYVAVYLLAAILWITELYFWPIGVLLVILLILNVLIEIDTLVVVSEKEISIKNYRLKKINWPDLENMIMKDGLLSLDFKTNKIFQAEIDFTKAISVHPLNSGSINNTEWIVGEDYPDLERSFNNFAKQKLDENK